MAHLVEFAVRAARDLEILYLEKKVAESNAAAAWFAVEGRKAKRTLRQLLYGKKPNVYRVIFEVAEGTYVVRVLTIRHGSRRQLKR
jgi:uncharacterized membrane protein